MNKIETKLQKPPAEIAVEDEEGKWLARPNYPLGKLQLEIYWNAFERHDKWLNLSPTKKKIINGMICTSVYDKKPEEYIGSRKRIGGMSLEELEEIYKKWDNVEKEYLECSKSLKCDENSFKKFIDLYTWMNTFMDMAFIYNTILEARIKREAHEKKMPQIFYEEALFGLQGIIEHEDVKKEKDAMVLTETIKKWYKEGINPMQLLEDIYLEKQELAQKIEEYAKNYRFGGSDLRKEVAFERVMERLIENIENGITQPKEYILDKNVLYFPEYPEFQRLLELAVKSKIKANNFHHTKPRGQWKFREKLIELGNSFYKANFFKSPDDIFELSIDGLMSCCASFGES